MMILEWDELRRSLLHVCQIVLVIRLQLVEVLLLKWKCYF